MPIDLPVDMINDLKLVDSPSSMLEHLAASIKLNPFSLGTLHYNIFFVRLYIQTSVGHANHVAFSYLIYLLYNASSIRL